MLNPVLYQALMEAFDKDVVISNAGTPGEYTIEPPKSICLTSQKMKKFADVVGWGEVYAVNCPFCGDTKRRLFFSHMFGAKIVPTKGSSKKPIYFSRYLARCHNEGCHRKPQFKKLADERLHNICEDLNKVATEEYPDPDMVVGADGSLHPAQSKLSRVLDTKVGFPKNTVPINSTELPGMVKAFVGARGWDPEELASRYMVRFAPQGSVWVDDKEEEHRMDCDRLLIPVVQSRRTISWQARSIVDDKRFPKYKNPKSVHKTGLLYNMDQALLFQTIVICEGVTDVWRVGPNAVAIFGKVLSATQLEIMSHLFGLDGKAVIMLDSPQEDKDTLPKADKMSKMLRMSGAFPGGVTTVTLPHGDPGGWSREDLRAFVDKALEAAGMAPYSPYEEELLHEL